MKTCLPQLQLDFYPKEDAMRSWMMLGIGALMLVAAVLPGGAWGATIGDVQKEMGEVQAPFHGSKLVMYVPMVVYGNVHMPLTDVCVSDDRLRPLPGESTVTDMGPVKAGNQYSVQIFLRDRVGNDIYQYERKISIPDCK